MAWQVISGTGDPLWAALTEQLVRPGRHSDASLAATFAVFERDSLTRCITCVPASLISGACSKVLKHNVYPTGMFHHGCPLLFSAPERVSQCSMFENIIFCAAAMVKTLGAAGADAGLRARCAQSLAHVAMLLTDAAAAASQQPPSQATFLSLSN